MPRGNPVVENTLRKITVEAMLNVRETLLTNLRLDPEEELRHITVHGETKAKEMLSCDRDAERNCRKALQTSAENEGINVRVLGEESLWDASIVLSRRDPYVVLLDMVDGSDLLERGFGNWCAAAVIFKPSQGKILASVIQDSKDNVYTATTEGVFFQEAKTQFLDDGGHTRYSIKLQQPVRLRGPRVPFVPLEPSKEDSRYASICFYAQKTDHFIRLPDEFRSWLNGSGFKGRLYTLAGNPMMAKLANGDRVNVVFEHLGQFAHDAVPGLHIALRAGAAVVRLDGTAISEADLAQSLYTPAKEHALKYVLASTETLAKQVAEALNRTAGPITYECPNPDHKAPIRVVVKSMREDGKADRPQYLCDLCDGEMTRRLV